MEVAQTHMAIFIILCYLFNSFPSFYAINRIRHNVLIGCLTNMLHFYMCNISVSVFCLWPKSGKV